MKNKSVHSLKSYHLYLKYKPFLFKDRYRFLITLILVSCSIVVGAVMIWMLGQGANALYNKNFVVIPQYLLYFGITLLVFQMFRYLSYYLIELMQQHVIHAVRRKVFKKLFILSLPFKQKQSIGDLLVRLNSDCTKISELVVLIPSKLFSFVVTSFFYTALLFYIDLRLALLALIVTPLFLIQQKYFLSRIRLSSREFLKCQGDMGGFEAETLDNMLGVNCCNAEDRMFTRFDDLFVKFRKAAMKNLLFRNLFTVSFEILAAFIAVGLLGYGVFRVSVGLLTVGDLVNFLLYLGYLIVPVRGLAHIPVEMQMNASAAERLNSILDAEPNIKIIEDNKRIDEARGINVNNLSFGYKANELFLKDLSINIKPGEFIGVAGPSGVGKTTLVKLLLRFYEPNKGSIKIGDVDIRDISLVSLRQHYSVVWQVPFLIDDSVEQNIRLAKHNATTEEIIHALKMANAYDFVSKLPKGLDTVLGNRGCCLSEGQKQRLSLAQAFVRKSPVLILDEATSALDSHSEMLIRKSLLNFRQHSTLIVIAHRYSTIANADRIIYLDHDGSSIVGNITELSKLSQSFVSNFNLQTHTATELS